MEIHKRKRGRKKEESKEEGETRQVRRSSELRLAVLPWSVRLMKGVGKGIMRVRWKLLDVEGKRREERNETNLPLQSRQPSRVLTLESS